MALPFTAEQFLDVFARYNEAIWPLQVVAYLLGLGAVGLAMRPSRISDRAVTAILALFWLWMGAVYHLVFFRPINGAAVLFGALFLIQGALFAWDGVAGQRLTFRFNTSPAGVVGALLVLYAVAVYPALGALFGHGYPYSPVFGVAPCPTTIFTFGLLLWTRSAPPKRLLVIPALWSLLGLSAVALGVREDIGLVVAALLALAVLWWRGRTGSPRRVPTAHGAG